MKPARIQRRRAKGWKMPLYTVYVGRGSEWGNGNLVTETLPAAEAVKKFEADIQKFKAQFPKSYAAWIKPLIGKNVACWCRPGAPCHGDSLLKWAEEAAKS